MRRLVVLTVLLAMTAACSNGSTPVTPVVPVYVTDTFPFTPPGTLNMNGAVSHDFSVLTGGTITAQITSLAPNSTQVVGLLIGTWNGTGCAVSIANDRATQGSLITGTATTTGSFCVRIYDVGQITDPIQYTLSVTHP